MPDVQWSYPSAATRSLVIGYVERRSCAPLGLLHELPCGFPYLQLMMSGRYGIQRSGCVHPAPRAALWGSSFERRMTGAVGIVHSFVVALTFEGAMRLFGDNLADLAGGYVDLEGLNLAKAFSLIDRLLADRSFTKRVQTFEALLHQAGSRSRTIAEQNTLQLASDIVRDDRQGSVSDVAMAASMSVRTLYNRFEKTIGCGPKRLLRLARLNRLIRTVHPFPWSGSPATDTFLEFSDQAHLCREFRNMTGLSPQEFRSLKLRTSDRSIHSFELPRAGHDDSRSSSQVSGSTLVRVS